MDKTIISASCHCQSVCISVATKPEYINDCNCSFCANSGAIWGYYDSSQVAIIGETISYCRSDRENPAVQIHSCKTCHATTHWTLTDGYKAQNKDADTMGVNMRLWDEGLLSGVELRFPDGKAWDGVSEYGYRKDSVIL